MEFIIEDYQGGGLRMIVKKNVICLPTEHLGVHENSLNHVRHSRSNWNLKVLVWKERGKPKYSEKNLLQQGREPTTNMINMNTCNKSLEASWIKKYHDATNNGKWKFFLTAV